VPGQHSEIAFDARDLHFVHLLVHEHAFRSDDLEVDAGR
jgi:hypothetical protein